MRFFGDVSYIAASYFFIGLDIYFLGVCHVGELSNNVKTVLERLSNVEVFDLTNLITQWGLSSKFQTHDFYRGNKFTVL